MQTFAVGVYLLCFFTCALCLALLIRSYRASGTRLLLWVAACFIFLAINSALVILDIVVFPQIDLRVARDVASLVAVSTLLYGFIWDTE